jgi:hypothetical protein
MSVRTRLKRRQVTIGKAKWTLPRSMLISPGSRPRKGIFGPKVRARPRTTIRMPATMRSLPIRDP